MDALQHCAAPDCGALDFLPITCSRCGGLFCAEHSAADKHACVATATAAAVDDTVGHTPPTEPCALEGCTEKKLEGWHCAACGQGYCARHRHSEDHGCSAAVAAASARNARMETDATREQRAGAAVAAAKATSARKLKKGSAMAQRIIVMRLRSKAAPLAPGIRGPHQRVLLLALHDASTDAVVRVKPAAADDAWSVGRVLDLAAKALRQSSVDNADPTRPRWHLLRAGAEGAVALTTADTLAAATTDGDVLVLSQAESGPAEWRDAALAQL